MTPEIPKGWEGWEKCDLHEATHGFIANAIYLIEGKETGSEHIRVSIDSRIGAEDFDALGITPVRKVQPIEFTVTATIDTGQGAGAVWVSILVDSKLVGKTFREVTE